MGGLSRDDIYRLTRAYLQQLDEEADGDELKCMDIGVIFDKMPLKAFGRIVIPTVVQELLHLGLVAQCTSNNQVRITKHGKERISRTVEANAFYVLETLVSEQKDEVGRVTVHGTRLAELTALTPSEINDAVNILEESGMVKSLKAIGTRPYTFYTVALTSRGRYEYERRQSMPQNTETVEQRIAISPVPVGSPYGFTDEDWELVTTRKNDHTKIYIVFGFQFESSYYNRNSLVENIEFMFADALHEYKKNDRSASDVEIEFKTLAAGYGGHLFNQIACDIISSDIVVFDISDRNTNVMIELGVALTWGTRVLLIRDYRSPKDISTDISGQTWAEYSNDGINFLILNTKQN